MLHRPYAAAARFARVLLPMLVLLSSLEPISALGQPARVESYELDVSFRPDSAALRGLATVDLDSGSSPDDEISFYLHGELQDSGGDQEAPCGVRGSLGRWLSLLHQACPRVSPSSFRR